MKRGQKVTVQPQQLFGTHAAIRFEAGHGPRSISAPRGASGEVIDVSADGREALVELYWNSSGLPGAGEQWRFWIKREFFGQLLLS